MNWRVAKSLLTMRDQVNAAHPDRHKENDGTIGDASHSARFSDHNPDDNGVVCAEDITNDPLHGVVSEKLAQSLLDSRDKRIKYVISNRKIASGAGGPQPWVWRPYGGSNPHDHHCHISVIDRPTLYDDVTPWFTGMSGALPIATPDPAASPVPPTLRKGAKGAAVEELQRRLNARGIAVKVNGDFDQATEAAVRKFQSSRGLLSDGVVGPQTRRGLAQGNLERVLYSFVFDDEGDDFEKVATEPGGAVKDGVSYTDFCEWWAFLGKKKPSFDDLAAMTREDAVPLYDHLYWKPMRCGELRGGVDYAVFDVLMNSGTSAGVKVLQAALGLPQDGHMSDALVAKANSGDAGALIDRICDARLAHMRTRPTWDKYKNGWSKRVARVRSRAKSMLSPA